MFCSGNDGGGFMTRKCSRPTRSSGAADDLVTDYGCDWAAAADCEWNTLIGLSESITLAMLLRLRRTSSRSSSQLDPLDWASSWSNTTCLKAPLNSLGSGLSRCPPLPRIIENKFSTQSWFNLFVRRKSQWPSLLRSCHNDTILWMVILQPVKQGKRFPSIVDNFANLSDTDNKNSLWPESLEIAWPNFLELEHDRLLHALNSWSINSIKLEVALASSGRAPNLLMAKIPAATEWLRIWAA